MAIEKYYRIGEVMAQSNLSRQTVHNYTTMGLIREEKRSEPGGHRLYSERVFAELERIKALKREGKTLLEIREILESERMSAGEADSRRGGNSGEAQAGSGEYSQC